MPAPSGSAPAGGSEPAATRWDHARASAREDVRSALARGPERCLRCGTELEPDASVCEGCGARLGDAPPGRRPWRWAIAALVALVVASAAYAAFVAPALRRERTAEGQEAAQAAEARRAVRLQRVLEEQRPRRGGAAVIDPRGLTDSEHRRARRRLVSQLEASITADSMRRLRAGRLRGPILRTRCQPYPRTVDGRGAEVLLDRPTQRYACLAITSYIRRGDDPRAGAIGYSFWATVSFPDGLYAFCRIARRPGEGSLAPTAIPVPAVCRDPGRLTPSAV